MRAAYVSHLGRPEAIVVGELARPVVGGSDVLVAVETVAVNRVDALIRAGRYRTPIDFPFVIGRDLVGRVAELGAASLPFRIGQRVWCNSLGHDGRQGSFAEYAAVPADRLYPLPDGVDPALAVALAHPAATAYLGWFVHAGLRAGETAFVGGAGGNVGMAALEMAALAGARVVASAAPADHDRCRRVGADAVLDYRDPALADRLVELVPVGVDVLWDTSGHQRLLRVPGTIAPGGRVLVTASVEPVVGLALGELYRRDVRVVGFVISRATVPQLRAAAGLINQMLATGRLTAHIADRLPLDQTAAAHRQIEAGRLSGRLLLDL